MTEEKLMALSEHRSSEVFSELEKQVLDYAVALTRTPADAGDELVEALREQLGEDGLVELTATIAWENYRSRFNRGYAVEAQGFSDGAYCPLPEAR